RGSCRSQQPRGPASRDDDAIADYDGAIAIDADFAEAPFNKSIALLLQGEFETGWKLWEWRWQQTRLTSPKRNFEAPLWIGDGDISGKTILLHSEQGLGDTIQFIRYAPMVADLGARVVVEARHPCILFWPRQGVLTGLSARKTGCLHLICIAR
ncbi:MAG: hypothetical protein VW870_02810, partial [Rhodobiaceae bacterium]